MLESCVFVLEKDRKRKEERRLEIVFLQRHFYGPQDHDVDTRMGFEINVLSLLDW